MKVSGLKGRALTIHAGSGSYTDQAFRALIGDVRFV